MTEGSADAARMTCDRCGAENPADARFCSACGNPFRASAEEERKLISVLFVDLEGFTASSDSADPEDVRDLLESYHTSAKECVEQYGGVLEKFIGDAVMAVFGAPTSTGEDAERAVRAGLEVLRRVQSLELSARAAVNTGEAVVRIGEHFSGEAIALGDVVNTASRMQNQAPAGRLVVGEETYRATRQSIRYERLPEIHAKGKADPLAVWLAVEPLAHPAETPGGVGSFVGRRRELDVIRTVWEQAITDSRPQVVTLLGSPGIGKSRLSREVSEIVKRSGGLVLRGRCLPYEERTGYQAFAQVVRQAAGIFDSDGPPVARKKLDHAIEELLPDEAPSRKKDLALLLGLGADAITEDRRMLFFSARRLVERLGEERPTLVVFEDVHWAATTELELMEYLAAHVRDTRAVFMALARPELLDTRPTWGSGSGAQTMIPLEPLADALAAELASELVPKGTDDVTAKRVVEIAAGNPLFIEELSAALVERGSADELPVTVRAAIAARVDALPADSRAALLAAAVVGRTFWQEVLRSISAVPELETVLEDLERRDLIRREPTSGLEGDVEFRFKHALIQEVAYGTLPRAVRRERHAATARFVEARADLAASVAWVLAYHWREAGQPEKAVPHLLAAAQIAQRTRAPEAVDLYTNAIELVADEQLEARIRLWRGMALVTNQLYAEALEDLVPVLPALDGLDLLDGLLYVGRAYIWTERHEEAVQTAERAVEVAALLDDDDRGVAATALLSQALATRGDDGDIDRAVELGDGANERWSAGSREYERADHLHLLANLYYWTGDYERARELASDAYALGGDVQIREAILRGAGLQAMAAAGLGRHEEALALLEATRQLAEELGGNPNYLLNYTSLVYRELFDLAVARRHSEEALEASTGLAFGMPRRFARSDLMITSLLEGDVGHAQVEWPRLWEDALDATGWTRWLILGRLATARAEIAVAVSDPNAVEWTAQAVEVTSRTRRRKYEAQARALHGEALVRLRRVEEGIGELRTAVALADSLVNPPGRWTTRAALARALYATGDDDDAARANLDAAEIATEFAASLSTERATAYLDAPAVQRVLSAS